MNKIKLANGNRLEIEHGSTGDMMSIVTSDLNIINSYVAAFTRDNLKNAEILNENDLVVEVIKNKYFDRFSGEKIKDTANYRIYFCLRDTITMEDRIAALEAENEALKESQAIQDGAIAELGAAVAATAPAV